MNEEPEPILVAPTEPIEYEITGVPTNDIVGATDTTPKRISISEAEQRAQKLAILRRMIEAEQRQGLRAGNKAKTKAKNRRKSQLAKGSRKRNR